MSFHVFFAFSRGLSKALKVPKGTAANLLAHVEEIERTLGLKRTTFGEGRHKRIGWDYRGFVFPGIDNKTLCATAERHNTWVRWVYGRFEEWAKTPVEGGDLLKPATARTFWHGLQTLKVEPHRWTSDFYRARMDELYEALRGREAAGMTFDAKPLTPRQAASVFNLFDQYLDVGDLRLDVPKGHDYLLPSGAHEGGYEWCEKCGAVTYEDGMNCRKRKCPIIEQFGDDE